MAVQGGSKNTHFLLFEEILFLKVRIGWRIIYQIELNGLADKDEVIVSKFKLASQIFLLSVKWIVFDKMNVH